MLFFLLSLWLDNSAVLFFTKAMSVFMPHHLLQEQYSRPPTQEVWGLEYRPLRSMRDGETDGACFFGGKMAAVRTSAPAKFLCMTIDRKIAFRYARG